MNYFQTAATTQELKDMYRQLCKTHHPDKGGTVAGMQEINTQYEAAVERILSGKQDEYTESSFYRTRQEETEVEARVREAIEKIAHIDGLDIEIIGAWVWVGGDTRSHKDTLKASGYFWMHKKSLWAFVGKASKSRGNTSLDDMRQKYGSEKVKSSSRRLSA